MIAESCVSTPTPALRRARLLEWRSKPLLVEMEAFLLSRGMKPRQARRSCAQTYRVLRRAGGPDRVRSADVKTLVPVIYPECGQEYHWSIESTVRWYQEFERSRSTSGPGPALDQVLEGSLCPKGPATLWKQSPELVQFNPYLIKTRHSARHADALCGCVFRASKVDGVKMSDLAVCDVDDFVREHFGDLSAGYRSDYRRAIRRFQAFWKASELSGNSGRLVEGVPA